jgi:hypothetical protein
MIQRLGPEVGVVAVPAEQRQYGFISAAPTNCRPEAGNLNTPDEPIRVSLYCNRINDSRH